MALVRPEPSRHDDVESLRARASVAEAALRDRRDELARVKSDLESFRIQYRQDVGLLHEELDELEFRLAAAELGELSKRLEDAALPDEERPTPAQVESAPRFTTDAIRKLFRDVAKSIHPDLARDDAARTQRHALMIAANRAYALGDEEQLRGILQAWERSPDAVEGSDDDAVRLRLVRRIAQAEEQIGEVNDELEALKATSLWQLKTMVDDAARQGKDLVADMVRRLKRDILITRNRLDAMTWTPRS